MKRKRIIMPTFEKIQWMPPTITLINTLVELGYDIAYITIYPDDYYKNFDTEHVTNLYIFSKNIEILKYFKNRIFRSMVFRIENFIKKFFAHFIGKKLNDVLKKDDILWVVNELTVIYAGGRFLRKYKDNFIFTMYELHSSKFSTRNIKKAAQYSSINVVPEYNRSHMQKLFFHLDKLPMVLPNKPEGHPIKKNMDVNNIEVEEIIKKIKKNEKKIVLYMGIIGIERPLETFIEAINELSDSFEFVVMGKRTEYLNYLLSKYPNKFTYIGYFTPPMHLMIASHADVGLLTYVGENSDFGLNAIYCAPNKIFEYTGFGMPIITNNIPGLYYTIEKNKCGVCVDMNNKREILEGLRKINNDYQRLSNNAVEFYNEVNVKDIINNIICKYQDISN